MKLGPTHLVAVLFACSLFLAARPGAADAQTPSADASTTTQGAETVTFATSVDQPASDTVEQDATIYRRAVAAIESEEYERAVKLLTPVFARTPAFNVREVSPRSTAFWLGTAYKGMDKTTAALQIWWTGLWAMLQQGKLDVHSTEVYLKTVFSSEAVSKYSRAAEAYLLLMQIADTRLADDERSIVAQHLTQLRPILPVDIEMRAFASEETVTLSAGGGKLLTRWWRSEDAYPATQTNERLVEHLIRVSQAEARYSSDRGSFGYDERGEILVRFGPPTKSLTIDFFSREMLETVERLQEGRQNNLIVSPSDFADNEFWLYERGDQPYHYLFIDDGNRFRIGQVAELIPRHLLTGMGNSSGRNAARADVVLEALRTCYEQLAPYDREYGVRYGQIQSYIGLMNELRTSLEGRARSEEFSLNERGDNSSMSNMATDGNFVREPHLVARSEIATSRQRDDILAYRQEERLPESVTQTNAELPQLPVAVYPARFLNDDGTTRVELFWGLAPSNERSLQLPDNVSADKVMVEMNISQLSGEYTTQHRYQQLQRLPVSPDDSDLLLFDSYVETKPIAAETHLRMQWDQWTMRMNESGTMDAERRLRSATARVDSLRPLQDESLEISDVVPLRVDPETIPSLDSRFPGTPYPFTRMTPAEEIGLHFEIYNLKTGLSGRTRYTVTYDVEIDREGRRFVGLFGNNDEQTSSSTSYDGTTTRAEETILLDTNRWEEGDAITVRVMVRDEIRNETRERLLQFNVVEK